jgi:hypothetical protein
LPTGARARFLLDDALRDDELAVARAWSSLPGIELDGVHVVGEGLLAGHVTGTRDEKAPTRIELVYEALQASA